MNIKINVLILLTFFMSNATHSKESPVMTLLSQQQRIAHDTALEYHIKEEVIKALTWCIYTRTNASNPESSAIQHCLSSDYVFNRVEQERLEGREQLTPIELQMMHAAIDQQKEKIREIINKR